MSLVNALLLSSLVPLALLLWRGPSAWDRLLAYNSASNRIVVVICIVAAVSGERVFLDVAIGYAALSFLGVVIIARFLERGGGHR